MPAITITLEGGEELIRELRKIGINVSAHTKEALLEAAEIVRSAAAENLGEDFIEIGEVSSGGGRDSGGRFTTGGMSVPIGPDDDHWYYRFIETGTAPHRIEASAAAALSIYFPGGILLRRGVDHPGIIAAPFLRPALDENTTEARDAIGDRLRRAIT